MQKMTIQVCISQRELEFLNEIGEKHKCKNNSETIRTMISRYKGMEDWIRERILVEKQTEEIKKAKVIKY